MTEYTITKRDEETECCECAYPLYIGEKAYMSDDERRVYCSRRCAGNDERNNAPLVRTEPAGVRVDGWWV